MANELATLDDLFLATRKKSGSSQSLDDLFRATRKKSIPTAIAADRAIIRKPSALEVAVPPIGGLRTIGRAYARGEAAIAEPLLQKIRQKYPVFGEDTPVQDMARGIKGESFSPRREGEQAELGDVVEEYGRRRFGVDVPDPVSSALGFAGMTALTAGTGALAKGGAALVGKTAVAAQGGARKGALRIAKGIMRPGGKYEKRAGAIAESALKEGVLRSSAERTSEAAQGKIDRIMQEVEEIAEKSTSFADLKPAFRRVAAAAKYWMSEGEPERAEAILRKMDDIATAKGLSPNQILSVPEILDLKRAQDAATKKLKPNAFFADTNTPSIETRQELGGGLRKILGMAEPEIGSRNKRISNLIDVKNVSGKRGNVSSRNNALDIVDYGLTAASMKNKEVLPLLIAKKAWQGGKALTARGLYGFSQFGKKTPRITSRAIPDIIAEDQRMLESPAARALLGGSKNTAAIGVSEKFGSGFERQATTPGEVFGRRATRGPKQITGQSPKQLTTDPRYGEGFERIATTPEDVEAIRSASEEALKQRGIEEFSKTLFKPEGVFGRERGITPKKFGLNPITGEHKQGKPTTAIQAALARLKKK